MSNLFIKKMTLVYMEHTRTGPRKTLVYMEPDRLFVTNLSIQTMTLVYMEQTRKRPGRFFVTNLSIETMTLVKQTMPDRFFSLYREQSIERPGKRPDRLFD